MKYTYLLIDIFTLLVPLIFSFHPKLKFSERWQSFLSSAIISAAFFVPFDSYFTYLKVWGFNPVYVTGIYLGNLPAEEILFFFCIPYACVFTYHCLTAVFKKGFSQKVTGVITPVLLSGCVLIAIVFRHYYYPVFAFVLLAMLLVSAQFILKIQWLPKFYFTYTILLIPFLIVNGLLTGTGLAQPIVWYNNAETIGLRILTIPVEDVFYGMGLILMNLLIFNTLTRKSGSL